MLYIIYKMEKMKRFIFILIILSLSFSAVYGFQENLWQGGSNLGNNFIDLSPFGIGFFRNTDNSSEFILCVSAGAGGHFNIIPNLLSPGLYFDIGIDLFSFLLNMLIDENNDDSVVSFGWTGVRVYNLFRFNLFRIQPFYGVTLVANNNRMHGSHSLGAIISYSSYGIEYNFLLPFNTERLNPVHRISFIWRMF